MRTHVLGAVAVASALVSTAGTDALAGVDGDGGVHATAKKAKPCKHKGDRVIHRSRTMRIVRRRVKGTNDARILACLKGSRRGRVIKNIPYESDSVYSMRVVDQAGSVIAYREREANKAGGFARTKILDVATRRGYQISRGEKSNPVYNPIYLERGAFARRTHVLADGRAIASIYLSPSGIEPPRPHRTEVATFTSTGVKTVRDLADDPSIDALSLELRGTTGSWLHDGQRRSAGL